MQILDRICLCDICEYSKTDSNRLLLPLYVKNKELVTDVVLVKW